MFLGVIILITNIFRIATPIVMWGIVLLFLPKQSLKRYLPVSLFCSCLLLIETLLSIIFEWWKVKGGTKNLVFDALTFIFGLFFTTNLWIFHFTYGKFLLYALCNLLMDLIFAYPLNILFQKIGHYKLKKFNSTTLFITSYALALLNYGFQTFMEKQNTQKTNYNTPTKDLT